jgi:hypothetical protein
MELSGKLNIIVFAKTNTNVLDSNNPDDLAPQINLSWVFEMKAKGQKLQDI